MVTAHSKVKNQVLTPFTAAMNRAAEKVAAQARAENRTILVWKNNQIVYEIPKIKDLLPKSE